MRKVVNLSKRQRQLTPLALCEYLVRRVMAAHRSERVAVLWTCYGSLYQRLSPLTDCWPVSRDARTYTGPYPVICHPPCGPWGKFCWRSRESKEHGIVAMRLVHQYGGIVEQPLGSQLFKLHGDERQVERIRMCDYGFPAVKETLLYIVETVS